MMLRAGRVGTGSCVPPTRATDMPAELTITTPMVSSAITHRAMTWPARSMNGLYRSGGNRRCSSGPRAGCSAQHFQGHLAGDLGRRACDQVVAVAADDRARDQLAGGEALP